MNIINRFRKYRKYLTGGLVLKFLKAGKTRVKSKLKTLLSSALYKTATSIWNYLIQKGISPRNAAAMLGNIMQESSLNRTAVQNGGDSAEGWFLMHGQDLKAYQKWKNSNKIGAYPELDYILYVINSGDHPYSNEYKRVISLPLTSDNVKYRNNVYGTREKNGTLYLIDDLTNAWKSDAMSLGDITDLFTNTIERAGDPRYEQRRAYAQDFYDHFYGN